MGRPCLKTARFSKAESRLLDSYLKNNPVFESFSSLARVATLEFIEYKRRLDLKVTPQASRPPFLWDYDLSEHEVRELLSLTGLSDKKKWLIERILSGARFEDVLSYVDVETIRIALPQLRLDPKTRRNWEYALERWSDHV